MDVNLFCMVGNKPKLKEAKKVARSYITSLGLEGLRNGNQEVGLPRIWETGLINASKATLS